jgi:hypothetical protein
MKYMYIVTYLLLRNCLSRRAGIGLISPFTAIYYDESFAVNTQEENAHGSWVNDFEGG